MKSKFKLGDYLVLLAALASLIYAYALWSSGHVNEALFVGLWVPSILGFAILVKLITGKHHG